VGQIKTVTDPDSGVTTYNYDTTGRLSTVVNANTDTVLTLTYDSADRIQTRTDSEGYTLTYAYDNLDRITSITYPDGTTDLYDYTFQSGPYAGTASLELRKHTDRLGRVTTYAYDADRRLTSVTEPVTTTTTRTTSYDYYEDGTLKDIIDANGNDTHWDIDLESRPIDKIYAYGSSAAQEETYAYENTTSRLHSITDALGQVKTFTYALDNRVTGITYTSTVNTTPNVTFAWDTYFPRMTSMVDGLGTTSYSYTAVGTLGALKLSSIDGPYSNDVIGLTYDALGRLAGRNITGGNETFGYDAISRLTSHGTPLGSFTEGYLGQTDQMTSQSVTNGSTTVSTNWGYDTNTNDRRLTTITNSGVTRSYTLGYGSGPTNVYDIQSITDTAAAGHPWATQSHAYTNDLIDRLLTASATTPGNFAYGYDNLDNATSVITPSGAVEAKYNDLNQLDSWGAKTYSYDADGNTLSGDGTKTYKWDAENRLIEIDYVGTSNKTTFAYDGIGHRTVQADTISGTTTTRRYLWCPSAGDLTDESASVHGFNVGVDFSICQSRDGSDNVLRRHMQEGELNVSSGQKLVYMPDQIGSVRDVLDATSGNLVQSYDYTPYGGVARSNGSTPTDYRYAGLFFHAASGLNLSTYRAFDGVTGRGLNRDPIRELGGPNLYMYTGADPINRMDTAGLGGEGVLEPIGQACTKTPQGAAICAGAVTVIIVGVACYDVYEHYEHVNSTPIPASPPMFLPRTMTCDTSCHGVQIDRNAVCPPFITGTGSGKNADQACTAAEKDANDKTPRGCYKRHCKCKCE
jgi:RHS repeat-associated protein